MSSRGVHKVVSYLCLVFFLFRFNDDRIGQVEQDVFFFFPGYPASFVQNKYSCIFRFYFVVSPYLTLIRASCCLF